MDNVIINTANSSNISFIPQFLNKEQCEKIKKIINDSDEKEQMINRVRISLDDSN